MQWTAHTVQNTFDGTWLSGFFGTLAREALELYRLPYAKAVAASKNFDPLQRMTEVAKEAAQFIGLGNQCGEGWFLTGDMIDLIEKGAKTNRMLATIRLLAKPRNR